MAAGGGCAPIAAVEAWRLGDSRTGSRGELAGAAALVTKPLRKLAGFALAAYAICVWPANFKHAIDGVDLPYIANGWLYHGPRLLVQPVLVWWALYCADIIDWPWRRRD